MKAETKPAVITIGIGEQSVQAEAIEPRITATIQQVSVAANFGVTPMGVAFENPVLREAISGEQYTGAYSVTPSNQPVTLPTNGKVLLQNVVVNPIPSNYGLITWNGAFLTVS